MYLITETKIFVDPHGEQDDGGIIKFISTEGEKYLEMNPDDDEELCDLKMVIILLIHIMMLGR